MCVRAHEAPGTLARGFEVGAPGGSVAKQKKVRAPYMKWWRGLSKRTSVPAPTFGWVCPLAI